MRKHIYSIILTAVAAGIPFCTHAKERSRNDIMRCASEVLIRNGEEGQRRSARNGKLEVIAENSAFTVVGFEGGAYAIVSNDDLLPEILGYSSTPYNAGSDNPGFQWWCRSIERAAAEIVATGNAPARVRPNTGEVAAEVPQLLTDIWGQMAPFNNLCPLEYTASGKLVGRTVVGCVATSASQVLRYHQYPARGEGIHVDLQTQDAFGRPIPLKVDFKDYIFDYLLMKDSYNVGTYSQKEADAVANLTYPVGVACGMIYGTEASGTYSDSLVYALNHYLKYPEARLMERYGQSEQQWMKTIFAELNARRPVLYSGADDFLLPGGGGHAFVLDGYDSDGLVHVNWGWYGRNNGYYEVALLNPRFHSFKNQQDMIIGVAPPVTGSHFGESLVLSGNISDEDIRNAVALSKDEGYSTLDLSKAILPDNRLPSKAFYASRFSRIILPETLTGIGDGVFGNCSRLIEVVFPTTSAEREFAVEDNIIYTADFKEVIEVLPYYYNNILVVEDYNSLLTFKEGVTRIHDYAADGCFRIAGVEIPASVTYIGNHAFSNATNLRVVTVSATLPPVVALWAFSSLDPAYTRLFVPAGYTDTYYRAGEWAAFYPFDNVFEYGTTVRARNVVREKGQPNPPLTYQVFGEYVTGEPELSCEADENSPAGDYIIKVEIGSLAGDNIILNDGVLRVIGNESGVDTAIADENGLYDVYTIDGRSVAYGIDTLEGITPGLYIVNGIKVIIRR